MTEEQETILYSANNNPRKPWICSECFKPFSTRRGAGDHFRVTHPGPTIVYENRTTFCGPIVSCTTAVCESNNTPNVRKNDHNEKYSKDLFECTICSNTYDGGPHRPRSLPCGHGFCTQCLQSCIARGNMLCPVCRVRHGSNSAIKLPVSFLLEELIHKAINSRFPKSECGFVPENVKVDVCPEHPGFSIYFQCNTHNVKVCQSCTGITQETSSCSAVYTEDVLKGNMDSQTVTVKAQMLSIKTTENNLITIQQSTDHKVNEAMCRKQTLEKELQVVKAKIEEENQEIMNRQKAKEPILKAIQSCQKNRKALELLTGELTAAANNQNMRQKCNLVTNIVAQSQKWQKTLEKELNVNVSKQEKYAQVKWNGIHRSSKVISERGKTIIPSLSRRVMPTSSAILIKENEMDLNSSNTTVFLDLSLPQGCILGRVYIRVLANRLRGKQFIMLALGTNGATFKGAHFYSNIMNERIMLLNYQTENKSECSDSLFPIENERYEYIKRGSLYQYNSAGFQIRTGGTDINRIVGYGYFGDVIAGLQVIDKAASGDYEAKDIIISECGIVLGY